MAIFIAYQINVYQVKSEQRHFSSYYCKVQRLKHDLNVIINIVMDTQNRYIIM